MDQIDQIAAGHKVLEFFCGPWLGTIAVASLTNGKYAASRAHCPGQAKSISTVRHLTF